MPNVSTGVLENLLSILLTVRIGVSRGPQTLCLLCIWQKLGVPLHLRQGLTSLCQEMTFEQWQLDRFYKWRSCLAQLHLPGRGWTSPVQRLRCMQDYHLLILWFHRSESVVFHFFWMPSFFLCLVGVLCFGACFVSAFWRHPAFCISPVLLQQFHFCCALMNSV